MVKRSNKLTMLEECPYWKFFWSEFSRIPTEYGEKQSISLYSVRMQENADQKKFDYGQFSRSVNSNIELSIKK